MAIGERSLPAGFSGLLPWGCIDNRPFLRALHGLAICRWRLGDFGEAHAICESLLWLNPNDNQGVATSSTSSAASSTGCQGDSRG